MKQRPKSIRFSFYRDTGVSEEASGSVSLTIEAEDQHSDTVEVLQEIVQKVEVAFFKELTLSISHGLKGEVLYDDTGRSEI